MLSSERMPHHFSLTDLCSSSWAFLLFGLFALAPGYAVGWLADLVDFRRRTPATRLVLSIPLSIGIAPLLAYLTARFTPMALTWCVFGLLWAVFARACLGDRRSLRLPRDRQTAVYVSLAALWLVVGMLSLIDWSWGNQLYFSVVSFDYTLRSAIVSAIVRDGVPPSNPYFFPGHAVALRYHYYWLIPCALVKQLGGAWVTARQAIIAGSLWCGLGLMATIALFLRYVHPLGARGIHRRILIGVALLAVTGLDILPNVLYNHAGKALPDPEWWNEQVSAWITTLLWVPHHTAALIAGLTAVLLVWHSAALVPRRLPALFAAAFCLAGSIGTSIYVGLVFAAALSVWTLVALLKRWRREVIFLVAMGALALALAVPQVWDLASASASSGGPAAGGHLLSLGVRHFFLADGLANHSSSPNLVYAAFLPLNYLLEFGFFLVAGMWFVLRAWRQSPAGRYELMTLTLAGTSLALCTFVRSSIITNNDLGYRGILLAQFLLLLWAVDLLDDRKAARRPLVIALLAVGVVSSVYEAATLRLYAVASNALALPAHAWLNADADSGQRNYELRAAYERLQSRLGAHAIVQQNPNTSPGDLLWGLYAERQTAADTTSCATVFGGDPRQCGPLLARIDPLFQGTAALEEVGATCRALAISAVLVKDTDPVWKLPGSWVWQRRPEISGAHVRVFVFGK
jgi:hypothetical protein